MRIPSNEGVFKRSYVAVLLLALAMVATVNAFDPQPDPPALFGVVGITASETARVNVVVLGNRGAPTAPGCRVTFTYLSGEGRVFKQEIKTILPGTAGSLDLTGAEALVAPGSRTIRAGIRPTVEVIPVQPATASCRIVATFELFDNATGKTSILMQPPPEGDKPAAGQ